MANPNFGTQLSEAGGGYTWAVNSRMNQLTSWSNDPVADPPAEWLLLQDLQTLEIWSATPSAWCDAGATYRVTHGQGWSSISHRHGEVDTTVTWCVDPETAVKQVRLHVVNRGHRRVQLRVVGLVEWMMGASRGDRSTVHTALHRQRLPEQTQMPGTGPDGRAGSRPRKLTALLCTQPERSAGFGDGTAFFALAATDERGGRGDLTDERDDWTCDRRECFDARGRLVLPDHFGQRSGSGLDPCAALSTRAAPAGRRERRTGVPAGLRRQPRRGPRSGDPVCGGAGDRAARRGGRPLGCPARRHHGEDARPAVRCDGEPLAALPDGVVPPLGARRLLPGRRRLWLSRPAAGRDGAGVGRPGDAARADRAQRVAPVRRGRRAALVACAGRRRRAHALLGRPCCGCRTPACAI